MAIDMNYSTGLTIGSHGSYGDFDPNGFYKTPKLGFKAGKVTNDAVEDVLDDKKLEDKADSASKLSGIGGDAMDAVMSALALSASDRLAKRARERNEKDLKRNLKEIENAHHEQILENRIDHNRKVAAIGANIAGKHQQLTSQLLHQAYATPNSSFDDIQGTAAMFDKTRDISRANMEINDNITKGNINLANVKAVTKQKEQKLWNDLAIEKNKTASDTQNMIRFATGVANLAGDAAGM